MAIEAARHGADITMAIIPEAQDMADCLKREIGEKYPRISVKIVMMNEISGKFDLLVNATPVGMYPKSDACPVSEEVIGNAAQYLMLFTIQPKQSLLLLRKVRELQQLAVCRCWFYRRLLHMKSGTVTAIQKNKSTKL